MNPEIPQKNPYYSKSKKLHLPYYSKSYLLNTGMYRTKIKELVSWKDRPGRKPLLINGARQVGKSWLVETFGREYFDGHIHTINFEKRRDIHPIFEKNLDPKRIIFELEIVLNISIRAGRDLLFFDEIQSCPGALGSLRYFYEEMPDLHLIAAGSLLDFEFRNQPFPVGRLELSDLHPMNFHEFLIAKDKQNLVTLLESPPQQLSEAIEQAILAELNEYFVVGGMPECVKIYLNERNIERVNKIQDELLYAYGQDFYKYQPAVNIDCLHDVLNSIAIGIGRQVIYSKLSERFSAPTIKKGVEVLKTARLLTQLNNTSLAGLPLATSGRQFKLFFLDIGLLLRLSKLPYQDALLKNNLTAAFKGMLSEQFVVQQITAAQKAPLWYWARTSPGSTAEIDLVIVRKGEIIPLEIKAGKSGSLKSLRVLMEQYPAIQKAYVLSQGRYGAEGKVEYIPLYYAGWL